MLRIELIPDMDHCIETVARKEHDRIVGQLITESEGNEELNQKAEILRLFMETAEFRSLRSDSERYLLEGKRVKFLIDYQNGALKYRMEVY